MGKIKTGILGGFQGKVGTVIGSTWRGENVMRALPKTSSKTPTASQKIQRLKFKTVSEFLNPLRSTLSTYFGNGTGVKSRYNLATSYHITNAVEMVDETAVLQYNRVMVSKGTLFGFQNPSSSTEPGAIVTLEWENNADFGNAKTEDAVSVVCYNEDSGVFLVYEGIAQRSEQSASITLPQNLIGLEVHLYVFLYNAASKTASNSLYLGSTTLV